MPRSSEKHVLWEWHRNSKPTEGYHNRVLIAQYSGFGEYAKFLNLVSPIHKQYAMERGYDYVILQGTLLEFPGIDETCNPNPRATFNKIPLLEMAIKEDYDYVLILDTDTLIVDVNMNLIDLLPPDQLVAAQRTFPFDWRHTWDVNAGVTLWNLKHSLATTVIKKWKHLSQYGHKADLNDHLLDILSKNDDQYFLQTILLQFRESERPVWSLPDEFNFYEGTKVKHFKRDERSWTTDRLDQRLKRVREAIVVLGLQHHRYHNLKSDVDYTKNERPE